MGLRDTQRGIVRDVLDNQISLGPTAVGKTIAALVTIAIDQALARQHGDPLGTLTIAETATKAADFVDGNAMPKVKLADGREIRLAINHRRLAQYFGIRDVVNIQKLMENREWDELMMALRDDTVHKIIAPDQIGFALMTLNESPQAKECLLFFLAKVDMILIEEIDKFLADQTHYIISDSQNAAKNPEDMIKHIRKMYDLMGLSYDASGKSEKVIRVSTNAEARQEILKARQKKAAVLIVEGEGRGKAAYLSDELKARLLSQGFELREIEEMRHALSMKYGEEFINSYQGELSPVSGGSQQRTHFSGRITKLMLSFAANEITRQQIMNELKKLESFLSETQQKVLTEFLMGLGSGSEIVSVEIIHKLREAGMLDEAQVTDLQRDAKRPANAGQVSAKIFAKLAEKAGEANAATVKAITDEIQKSVLSLISSRELENSLTQSTDTSMGIIKGIIEEARQSKIALSLESLRSETQIRVGQVAGDDARRGYGISAEYDGQWITVRGRRGVDRINVANLTQGREFVPWFNNHISIERQGDTIIFRRHIRVSGTTATYSPLSHALIGMGTVARDRSSFTTGIVKDSKDKIIRNKLTTWDGNKQTVSEDIALSDKSNSQSDNQARFAFVKDASARQLDTILASLAAGWSHLAFIQSRAEYDAFISAFQARQGELQKEYKVVKLGEKVAEAKRVLDLKQKEIQDFEKQHKRDLNRPPVHSAHEQLLAEKRACEIALRDTIAAEENYLRTLANQGGYYMYVIDAKSYAELIPVVAAIANQRSKQGFNSLIVTNNMADTGQGIDFDGKFTLSLNAAGLGFRQYMQIMGRIVRGSGTLGPRYVFLNESDFETSKNDVKKYQLSLKRALQRINQEFEENLEWAFETGRISYSRYEQERKGNEYLKAINLIEKLTQGEELSPLDWLTLAAAYHYVEDDVTASLLHKLEENMKNAGHTLFRGLSQDSEGAEKVQRAIKDAYLYFQNEEKRNEDVGELGFQQKGFASGYERLRYRLGQELNAQERAFQRAYVALGGDLTKDLKTVESSAGKDEKRQKALSQIRTHLLQIQAAKLALTQMQEGGEAISTDEEARKTLDRAMRDTQQGAFVEASLLTMGAENALVDTVAVAKRNLDLIWPTKMSVIMPKRSQEPGCGRCPVRSAGWKGSE
jgi:hypothetical protein